MVIGEFLSGNNSNFPKETVFYALKLFYKTSISPR